MQIQMPAPVRQYFQSEAFGDTTRIADCFTSDAVVTDERRTHVGREAIRAWKAASKAATKYHEAGCSRMEGRRCERSISARTGKACFVISDWTRQGRVRP